MEFKAVIFDLDGTLLNSLEDIAGSANKILATHCFPTHKPDDYKIFVGSGISELMTRALPEKERDPDTVDDYVKEYREEYARNWNARTKPYAGIAAMLDELVSRKIKLAVLSNKLHAFTKQCVNELLPRWKFNIVMGLQNDIPPKPDPASALQIAKQLNIDPPHILYVGDSDIDMKTAVAAYMHPVGVLWGFRTKEELQKNGAKTLIEKPQELLALI
ncbi:MAG: HAD family hydrolase [Deltaproteobacteria bacterium]|jgi:phosphoglycolate phosphatase|nr:HAD family hydrolase [Deltaproteobacteria bacterium]